MRMTQRSFGRAVGLIKQSIPMDSEHDEQLFGRVFVAAGYVMRHRLKLPDETMFSPTQAEVVAFLDSLNSTQKRKLRKIAEGITVAGEMSFH